MCENLPINIAPEKSKVKASGKPPHMRNSKGNIRKQSSPSRKKICITDSTHNVSNVYLLLMVEGMGKEEDAGELGTKQRS